MRNQKEDFELCDMITKALNIDSNISKPASDAVLMNDKNPFTGSFGILVDQNEASKKTEETLEGGSALRKSKKVDTNDKFMRV